MAKEPSPAFLYARSIARRPGVRRFAEPIAAKYYSFRHRGLDDHQRWESGASFESAHWDEEWIGRAKAIGLLDPEMPLSDSFVIEAIDSLPRGDSPVTLLDVGAGPLTPLGKRHPRRDVQITACDALAESYDAMLDRAGIVPPVRTVFAEGEHLIGAFGIDQFDIVHCGNALDHHYDPISALEQMLAVAKPGGLVLLNHYENEGEFQHYMGMHQWNITESAGHLRIWNAKHTYDVTELYGNWATVQCSRGGLESGGRERVMAVIRRSA